MFVKPVGSNYRFTPALLLVLKYHLSSNEQLVYGPTTKQKHSHVRERVGLFVQVLETLFKEILIYYPKVEKGVNFILCNYIFNFPFGLVPKMISILS